MGRKALYYYASTGGVTERRLLLGPFTEKAVAETTRTAAREVEMYAHPSAIRTSIEIIEISLPRGVTPPSGELNDAAVLLYGGRA